MLDTNKVYTHDELFKVIYEEQGTFNLVYEVSCVSHHNTDGRLLVCIKNILVEYNGEVYECDHLWFNNQTVRDETIRLFRINGHRKGGVRGKIRSLEGCIATKYIDKHGDLRYSIYKEPAIDGPDEYIIPTRKYQHKMNELKKQLESNNIKASI